MTQPRGPEPQRHPVSMEPLDPLLSKEESALLHIPCVVMAAGWQAAQSCTDPSCLACRIGRAVSWMTKGQHDILTALKVLNDLVELVHRDPDLGPRFQADLASVSLHELDRVCEGVEYWSKNLGYACGMKPLDKDDGVGEVGITLYEDPGDGAVVASVVRRQRPAEGDEGKVN